MLEEREYKRKSGDQITTSKSIFPTGTMSNLKTTTEAQHSWIKSISTRVNTTYKQLFQKLAVVVFRHMQQNGSIK